MNSKLCSVLTSSIIAVVLCTSGTISSVFGQCLDCVPGFSPAFSDSYNGYNFDGSGYSVYRGPHGTYGSTYLGPYRPQNYVDFSNVPIYYGPMRDRYRFQYQPPFPRNMANNLPSDRGRPSGQSANQAAGSVNRKSDRIPIATKTDRRVILPTDDRPPEKSIAEKMVVEKPVPIPFELAANDKLPAWYISGTEFIDRYVKAGDLDSALTACERLIETRSGLPGEIYTRAAVLSFLSGRDLDIVGDYIALGTADGFRLSSRNLPGGSLEKYLSPAERQLFVDTVTSLRQKALHGDLTDDQKKIIETLLQL